MTGYEAPTVAELPFTRICRLPAEWSVTPRELGNIPRGAPDSGPDSTRDPPSQKAPWRQAPRWGKGLVQGLVRAGSEAMPDGFGLVRAFRPKRLGRIIPDAAPALSLDVLSFACQQRGGETRTAFSASRSRYPSHKAAVDCGSVTRP